MCVVNENEGTYEKLMCAYSNYYIMFDPSCDQIGAPPYRQLTQGHAGTHFKVIRYTQGNVHIIFEDMEGSTVMEKK